MSAYTVLHIHIHIHICIYITWAVIGLCVGVWGVASIKAVLFVLLFVLCVECDTNCVCLYSSLPSLELWYIKKSPSPYNDGPNNMRTVKGKDWFSGAYIHIHIYMYTYIYIWISICICIILVCICMYTCIGGPNNITTVKAKDWFSGAAILLNLLIMNTAFVMKTTSKYLCIHI
jgi:hypothetical protein